MTTSEMVRQLCKENHVSLSELSRRVGQSPQNFSKKLQRETLTLDELNLIGEALGVSFEQSFVLQSGRRISTGTAVCDSLLPDCGDGITALPSSHPLRKALTGDYSTVIFVDGPTGHCTFYALSDDIKRCFGKILNRNPGIGIVSSLLVDNYVSPEDRQVISNVMEMNSLREALNRTPIISKIFRRLTENGEKYNELRIIRVGDAGKIQGAVVAVINRDEMIREKLESSALNEKRLAVTDSLAGACAFVALVDMKCDTAWICRISGHIRELYGNIDQNEIPFGDVLLPVFFRDVHPDDKGSVEKALSPDTIRAGLALGHDYSESFRYKFGDRFYYAEMRISRYENDENNNSFVLSFINRDGEVLRIIEKYRNPK